jgi:hypothetical protein
MKIEKLNVLELEVREIENINGGSSELSNSFMYGLGVIARCCYEFAQGASAGSQVNGGVFYK